MRKCKWCGRDGDWPVVCMNSRDMTDSAINGDETCFESLAGIGWGEAGESYVRLNKAAMASRGLAINGPFASPVTTEYVYSGFDESAPITTVMDEATLRDITDRESLFNLCHPGGWQPIETAPKDGSFILMFASQEKHESVTLGGWFAVSGYWDTVDGAWCSHGSTYTGPFYQPTHWMPLPSAPKGE